MMRATLRRSLIGGAVLAVAVAVIGGAVGLIAAGVPGLLGALVGALSSAVFLGLTAVSMLLGMRVARGDLTNPLYYAVVLGAWLIKMILFGIAAFLVRGADWLDPYVFLVCVIVAVVGSLVVDVVALARTQREVDSRPRA